MSIADHTAHPDTARPNTARPDLPPLAEHPLVYSHLLQLVTDTPLLRLPAHEDSAAGTVWGKLEAWNPGGSVKDRICLAIIEEAEASGLLRPGGIVVEPTSGNTGVGLALVCKSKGYRCVLTMPQSMSLERRALLELMGAELVLTPPEEQMNGAIRKANELAEQLGAFVPHQFENHANPSVHERTTGPEILHALRPFELDAFVAGVGTGGTISGVGRYLRVHSPATRVVAVEPENCPTLSAGIVGPTKIQGLAPGFVPRNFDRSVVDEIRTVSDRGAYAAKGELGRRAGLLVGISAGAAASVAYDLASELGPHSNVVVVLPDTGERYFSLDDYFADNPA